MLLKYTKNRCLYGRRKCPLYDPLLFCVNARKPIFYGSFTDSKGAVIITFTVLLILRKCSLYNSFNTSVKATGKSERPLQTFKLSVNICKFKFTVYGTLS